MTSQDGDYAGFPSHLQPIEPEIVNALCDRAIALCDRAGFQDYHIILESKGFRESRTPWDARRLARALAISHSADPLVPELFTLALKRAGLEPDIGPLRKVAAQACVLAAIIFLSGMMMFAAPAAADWPDEQLTYRGYKRDLYWGPYHCGGAYRAEGCEAWRWRRWRARQRALHKEREEVQYRHSAPSSSPGDRDKRGCLVRHPVHVWSGQHNTEGLSKADAQRRWMIATQASHGSIYMNFGMATGIAWRCFQSQSHDTLIGKGQKLIGKALGGEGYYQVCELWATPCAAPVERAEKETDRERD